MNRQEIFNKVCEHLIKQNEKAMDHVNDTCMYRSGEDDNPLCCGIGCLIPDELYDPLLEGRGIRNIFDHRYDCTHSAAVIEHIGIETEADLFFINALQVVHDSSFVADWPLALREKAIRYRLDQPACIKEILYDYRITYTTFEGCAGHVEANGQPTLEEAKKRAIKIAIDTGWTPPKWWQWWRWNDTRP